MEKDLEVNQEATHFEKSKKLTSFLGNYQKVTISIAECTIVHGFVSSVPTGIRGIASVKCQIQMAREDTHKKASTNY